MNDPMTRSVATPVANQNDHVAAAAYLMKQTGAIALVVVEGQWPGRPGSSRKPTLPWRWRPERT